MRLSGAVEGGRRLGRVALMLRGGRLARPDAVLGLAFVAGLGLRVYQLPDQIIGDDEWHALHAVVYQSYSWILSHFGLADHTIPLTVFYRLMADTVGLSEWVMRAPILLFGLASLVVFPLMVRGFVGPSAASLFAWLLAISPLHVYYSRYARPYSISCFLAFVGVVAFFRWWSGGGRRWSLVYALCAVLGPFAHLTVTPFLLAPFPFAIADWIRQRGRRPAARSLGELIILAAVVGAGLVLLLAAPVLSDWGAVAGKFEKNAVTRDTVLDAARLHAGTRHSWLVLLVALLAAVGAGWLARGRPRLLVYLGFLGACQFAVAVVTRPSYITVPIVLARYTLPVLPILLLLVAAGVGWLEERIRTGIPRCPAGMAGVATCALLLYAGPLAQIYYRPNAWTNHALFEYGYDEDRNWPYSALKPRRVSAFYAELGRRPPASATILEVPWYYEWHNIHYPYYQRIHRQRMRIGFVGDVVHPGRPGELPLADPRFAFRNFVHVSDRAALLARGIRFVVFHKDLNAEFPAFVPRPPVDVAGWVAHYRDIHGPPVYEDDDLVVFDPTRLAGRPAGAPGGAPPPVAVR